MRSVKVLVAAAGLLLACATHPALAASVVPVPDSAAVADTSAAVWTEEPSRAAPSLADAMPSARSLALLRTRVGRRTVRVGVGQDDYKLSRARFESSGVVFSPVGREGMSLWAGEGESPVSSPIAWDRIDCIRAQHSNTRSGAIIGALLGSGLLIGAVKQASGHSSEPGMEWLGAVIYTPLAGAAGAYVGAFFGGTVFATWPIVWRPASAGSPVPTGDAGGATDASSLQAPAAAPPAAPRTPSPAEIATVRERVAHHDARIHLGGNAYDIRGAGFESGGVTFTPGDLHGVPAGDNGGPDDDFTQPAPLASPIGWDRIDRIQVRKPCGLRGALAGAVVGAAAYTAILSWASHNGKEVGFGALVLLPLVPLGAGLGSAVGASAQRSEPVWQRETDRSASAPGAHR